MRTKREIEKHKTNPFIRDGIIYKNMMLQNASIEEVVSASTGEVRVVNSKTGYPISDMDILPFRKLFKTTLEDMMYFTLPEIKLVLYIALEMSKGADEVYIDADRCKKQMNIQAGSTVRLALRGLLEKNYIALKEDRIHTYFVNTNKIFNGDRRKKCL